MRFDANTTVADALDADPSLIDRLVALNGVFARLRNPEERMTLGAMVSLADAAVIAGVDLTDLLQAANAGSPLACASANRDPPAEDPPAENPPDWMTRFDEAEAAYLDVRPLVARDESPFTPVMTAAAAVPPGGGLVLDVPFNPLPLRRILGDRGFASYGRRLGRDRWRICCLRAAADAGTDAGGGDAERRRDMPEGARVWSAADGVHIDVRRLAAPAPLVAILTLIDGGGHAGRIIVHHHREPHFLYPELEERGWSSEHVAGAPGEVRLLLTAGAGSASGETTAAPSSMMPPPSMR